MAKRKSMTIKLTDRQRRQLRAFTGEDHTEIKVVAVEAPAPMSSKTAPKVSVVGLPEPAVPLKHFLRW